MFRPQSLLALVGLIVLPALARADDWPQWLGPQRDGVWRETGLLEKFPKGGPKVLWRATRSSSRVRRVTSTTLRSTPLRIAALAFPALTPPPCAQGWAKLVPPLAHSTIQATHSVGRCARLVQQYRQTLGQ